MPIYDYHCDRCGHAFSAVRSYTEDSVPPCPKCGAVPRRLITTPAIVFKGSGWYKTDSRAGTAAAKDSSPDIGAQGAKSETKGDAKSETKSATKGEAKSETKSDAKTETKATEKKAPASGAAS